MLTTDETRFALEDARRRQAALLDLIYSIESQAGRLLSLYVTLGLASASAATAIILGTIEVPVAVGVGLLGAMAVLLVGSLFCFGAMKPALVGLPGRGADFWVWAHHEDNDFTKVALEYLSGLQVKQDRDHKHNQLTAGSLAWAKRMGIFTPLAALIGAALAHWLAV